MNNGQHSSDHHGLHLAATAGDDEGVLRAIDLGADVNGLDAAGRTALMCAVAGDHWQNIDASNASFMNPKRLNAIRILLKHPDISLLSMNSPQNSMNGVIPLGMAAWLNMVDAVQLLLEDSGDAVSVDGMDSHGATALMYAARDGGLEVVQLLLAHGARPDFRDCNHRTSIQFALEHPQVLWLCESALRRHRWRESQSADRNKLFSESEGLSKLLSSSLQSDKLEPPPLYIFADQTASKLTATLISSILSSDLSFIHSLLFAPALPPSSPPALYPMSVPVLVNRPDLNGWSPIHHCVSAEHPSIQVLDALYCAGADVTLFTPKEHYTPLHILALTAYLPTDDAENALYLYQFTVHLVRDLRAPLSARDKNDETCIHVAAEHGSCADLLMILLDCDTTGGVRELRNSRGLTALEVAKPEFRAIFGNDAENLRSVSSLSTRTIRPTDSFASLASFSECQPKTQAIHEEVVSLYVPLGFDVEDSTHQLLSNLRVISPSLNHSNEAGYVDHHMSLLDKSMKLSQEILGYFRSRVEEAMKEVQSLRADSEKINALLDLVAHAASDKLEEHGCAPFRLRTRTRDSEDSQTTAVSTSDLAVNAVRNLSMAHSTKPDGFERDRICVSTQTVIFDVLHSNIRGPGVRSTSWTEWLDGSVFNADSSTFKTHLASLAEVEREIYEVEKKLSSSSIEHLEAGYSKMDPKLKQLSKKKSKLQDKIRELGCEGRIEKKDCATYGTAKIKAWIKRIITPDRPTRLEIVKDVDEGNCNAGREVKTQGGPLEPPAVVDDQNTMDVCIEGALRTSHLVLDASKRDLLAIEQCLASAQRFINLSNHAISRAERIVEKAVKKREVVITNIRITASNEISSDDRVSAQQEPSASGTLGSSNLLSLRPSMVSLSSTYSSHSSCRSVTPTSNETDDEDIRAIRRLLLRKIEAGIIGSWDEMDKAASWLRIVKEAVRGVKRRAYLL